MATACAGQQVSLQGRGLPSTKAFKGISTFAGRHQGVECSLGIAGTARGKVALRRHLTVPCRLNKYQVQALQSSGLSSSRWE